MKKVPQKETAKYMIFVEYAWDPYTTVQKNKRAAVALERWLHDLIHFEAAGPPLFIDKDENGSAIEDYAERVSLTVVRVDK